MARLPRPRLGWRTVLVAAVVAVLAAVGLFAWQAASTATALARAGQQASALGDQLATGDATSAERVAAALQDSAARARRDSDGPLWAVAAHVPVLGDDVRAVRVVARETDRIAREALPPVLDVAQDVRLEAFSPADGRIDVANLVAARPQITAAADVLTTAQQAVATIDVTGLVGRLQVPVGRLRDAVDVAATSATVAAHAADLLPPMLGAQEPRRYLLIVQNNAEARSLGGIPGSWAVIETDRGRLEMTRQGSTFDIPPVDRAPRPVPDEELSVYPSTTATDFRNTTIDADFPSAARYAAALAADVTGAPFDGVVSVDPVTLGHLLDGVGEITLDDGTRLTADTAVDELLNGVYRRYADDPLGQDAVFEDAARRIFDAFVGGDGDTQAMLRGLVRAAGANRVMVWSRDAAEQEVLAETGLGGVLSQDPDVASVGVFVSDASASKMQYYLDTASSVRPLRCVDDNAQELRLVTRLGSTVESDARLPASVQGVARGLERGEQRLNLRIVAPPGGAIRDLAVNGEARTIAGGRLDQRWVTILPIVVGPQESVSVTATVVTGPGQTGEPVLTTTPGVRPTSNDVRSASACG